MREYAPGFIKIWRDCCGHTGCCARAIRPVKTGQPDPVHQSALTLIVLTTGRVSQTVKVRSRCFPAQYTVQQIEPFQASHIFRNHVVIFQVLFIQATERTEFVPQEAAPLDHEIS